MRAIAALCVVAFHAAFFAGAFTSHSALRPYLTRLDVGVAVFFLISGFLLYRPFVRARFEDTEPPRTGPYAWRRFLRIVPAYWVALTLVAAWLGVSGVFTPSGVATFYGFGQIYGASTAIGGLSQAWTLCVEVTFYAFLPLWAWLMSRLRSRDLFRSELAGLAALFVMSVAWKLVVLLHVDPASFGAQPWLMALPNFLDQFAAGMALAVVSVRYAAGVRPAPIRLVERAPWLAWLAALVAFWLVAKHSGGGVAVTRREVLERHELFLVVALCLLLPAVFGDRQRGFVPRLLGRRELLYVGLVSYGVYLYHYAVVKKLAVALNHTLVSEWHLGLGLRFLVYFLVGTAGAVALASASYWLVERPALSLKRRFGEPAPAQPEEALVEPAPVTPT